MKSFAVYTLLVLAIASLLLVAEAMPARRIKKCVYFTSDLLVGHAGKLAVKLYFAIFIILGKMEENLESVRWSLRISIISWTTTKSHILTLTTL